MSGMVLQDARSGEGGASDPVGISVEVSEVVYHCREAGPLQAALTLVLHEVLALKLPLNEVELVLELFGLLIMLAVSFHLTEQPPVGEGHDVITQGEVQGGGALKKPLEPARHWLGIICRVRSWGGIEFANEGVGTLVIIGGEPGNSSL